MTKLKLSAIPDDRPVKLTIELPGAVHRDLVAYAEIFAKIATLNGWNQFCTHRLTSKDNGRFKHQDAAQAQDACEHHHQHHARAS